MHIERLALAAAGLAVSIALLATTPAMADEVSTYGGRCRNNPGAGRAFTQDYYVYFDTNSSRIKPDGQERIEYVHGLATGKQAGQICLFGKSSKTGDEAANARLARKRAANVAHAFEALGWPRSKIVIVPEGEAWGWLNEALTSDSEDDRRVRMRLSF
ncbi:OmpA family protein [Parvibaculum sedimenti]|nr:OmpA family protein [Parvibaculum sedimenti]